MSLRTYVVPKQTVEIPGNEPIVVRGLSLEDLSPLLTKYRPELQQVWDTIEAVQQGKTGEDINVAQAIQIALQICPPLVGGLIAYAADEPDLSAIASKLPLAVQVDAIQIISNMTFEQNGGAVKLWEAVISMIKGVAVLAKPQIAALKSQDRRFRR